MSLAALLAGAGGSVARASDETFEPATVFQLTRADVTQAAVRSLPGYRADIAELSLQHWASSGRAGVGFGVGSVLLIDRPTGGLPGRSGNAAALTTASGTTLMLGLRYRASEQSSIYADASHVRGLALDGDDRIVSKVGVEFKAAQSNWKIDYGGLGLRLAGDARMTLKLRRGGLAISMRRAF
jgi:hypothetical protein